MMLSAALSSSGLLTVNGTTYGEQISLAVSGSKLIVVDAGVITNFAKSAVKSASITLAAGPDQVLIASTVSVPMSITAGSGADTLVAGSGRTTFIFGSVASSATVPTRVVIAPNAVGTVLDFTQVAVSDVATVNLSSDSDLATFGDETVVTQSAGQASFITTVLGGSGDDMFTGNAAPDSLVGGSGNSTLVAGSGADTLVGSGTSTDYVFSPEMVPTIYTINQAKTGANLLDFSSLPSTDPLTVNLLSDQMASYTNVQIVDAKPGQYSRFNEIYDGQGDNSITGNGSGDTILGGAGNETITGGTGADFIYAGSGNDIISGQGGQDTIFGGSGSETIYAVNSFSDPAMFASAPTTNKVKTLPYTGVQIYAGSGNESIVGSAGNDTLIGGSGSDTIHGLGGSDNIIGGDSGTLIFGDTGNDTIAAGLGDTTIAAGSGQSVIYGGTEGGSSNFIDANIPDTAAVVAGGIDPVALTANAIAANQGLATPTYPLLGATGPGDIVIGGSANTTVIGGAGDDTLRGGDGPSTVVAGSGNDLLIAGYGNDVIQGGAGEDTMAAGGGPDSLTGGAGNDVFLNVNGYADTITGGLGFNIAQVDPTGLSTFSNIQVMYDPSNSGAAPLAPLTAMRMTGLVQAGLSPQAGTAPGPATLVGSVLHVGSSTYTGVQGIQITESAGTVQVYQSGVGFQNFAAAGLTLVSVLGGSGADTFNVISLAVPVNINTGAGNNYVVGGLSSTTITGGTGDDTIYGNSGPEHDHRGAGNNIIYGGIGNDSITGGAGSDWIYPTGAGVSINGDHESDTIVGGTGTEKVDLAGNNDPMTIRLDKNTITDNATGSVTTIKNVKNLWAGSGNDLIVGSAAAGVLLNAGSGNDTVYGISSSDVFYGGLGDDQFFSDGSQGFTDLLGDHASATANFDNYNPGTTVIPSSVDATDHLVALQHYPA